MGMDYYLSNNRKLYISIKTTLNAYGYVSLFDDNEKEYKIITMIIKG